MCCVGSDTNQNMKIKVGTLPIRIVKPSNKAVHQARCVIRTAAKLVPCSSVLVDKSGTSCYIASCNINKSNLSLRWIQVESSIYVWIYIKKQPVCRVMVSYKHLLYISDTILQTECPFPSSEWNTYMHTHQLTTIWVMRKEMRAVWTWSHTTF